MGPTGRDLALFPLGCHISPDALSTLPRVPPLEPSASPGRAPTSPDRAPAADLPARIAAAVCLLEAAGLGATAARFATELTTGTADDPSVAGMSLVVTVIFTGLLLLLAAHWWRGRRWPRTPTIVWNLLLLPTAWTLSQTNGPLVGGLVALVALTGVAAAWASPAPDLPEDGAA